MLKKNHLILLLFFLLFSPQAFAAEGSMAEAYYDFGVFTFESGDYEAALAYFQKSVDLNPTCAPCRQFLGKTLHRMERYEEALAQIRAAEEVDPLLSGLKYDKALVYFQMDQYAESEKLFAEIAKADPLNVLAHYYCGISNLKLKKYDDALHYLTPAVEKSPTIRINGTYYMGVCRFHTGDIAQAAELFQYVAQNAEPGVTRKNAEVWLETIAKHQKAQKNYSLYFSLRREYDDNVRLTTDDLDTGSGKDDWLTAIIFSGRYNFFQRRNFTLGAGYVHYQDWHDELQEYDTASGTMQLQAGYMISPYSFALSYSPTFFQVDGEDYLFRHQARLDVERRMNAFLTLGALYRFSADDYDQENVKDGERHEFGFTGRYRFWNGKATLFARLGYEIVSAEAADEEYGRLNAALGFSCPVIWEIMFASQIRYANKEYDAVNADFEMERSDDRVEAMLSLSRRIYYEWLEGTLEWNYLKNDSNISRYEYDDNRFSFQLSVSL